MDGAFNQLSCIRFPLRPFANHDEELYRPQLVRSAAELGRWPLGSGSGP